MPELSVCTVCEELNLSRLPNTTQTLVGRTRDFIGSVAAGQLSAISPQLSTTPLQAIFASHPLRFKKKVSPSKAKKPKKIFPTWQNGEEYVLKEEMVLIKGEYAVVRYDDLDAAANYLIEIYASTQWQNNAWSTQDDEPYIVADSPSPEVETAALRPTSDNEDGKNLSATQILEKLKSKMKPVAAAKKDKIEWEDLVMDVLQIYKDPDFDPTVPLRLQIKGEPAVDTGGVK